MASLEAALEALLDPNNARRRAAEEAILGQLAVAPGQVVSALAELLSDAPNETTRTLASVRRIALPNSLANLCQHSCLCIRVPLALAIIHHYHYHHRR